MSTTKINQSHPLRRAGSTRVSRLLKALSPDYFKLDDRSVQDLVVATHRYANLLNWFDADDRPDGSWACFWETETLTYLAVLSALDLEQLRQQYDEADRELGLLLESSGPDEPAQEAQAYRTLIGLLRQMALDLEKTYRKLGAIRHPLQRYVLELIRKANRQDTEELSSSLDLLIGLNKAFDNDLNIEDYTSFIESDGRWGLPDRAAYGRITALAPTAYPRERLRSIFVKLYQAYAALKQRGQQAFDQELARMEKPQSEEYRLVQPHVSLYLAFLQLFRYAQESLNGLVRKQLDFYYEQVLALRPAPARPDSVYLIFTLAKNFDPQKIDSGAQLLGGKDTQGRPLLYETVSDWVVSQAKLEEVKSFYLPKSIYSFNYDPYTPFTEDTRTLIGQSYPLPLPAAGVRPFSDGREIPEEEAGFVIASPQLLLQEGRRLIVVSFENIQGPLDTDILKVALSGKEGWIPIVNPTVAAFDLSSVDVNVSNTLPTIPADTPDEAMFGWIPEAPAVATGLYNARLVIYLPKDFEPVEASPALGMTHWPALKITLKPEQLKRIGSDYSTLVSSLDTNRKITIGVRAEGVSKNLVLQTDQGIFNGTQQLMPFGPTVLKGSRFYVGFGEAFYKKLEWLRLRPNWLEPKTADDIGTHYANYNDGLDGDGNPINLLPISRAINIDILSGNEFKPLGLTGEGDEEPELGFDNTATLDLLPIESGLLQDRFVTTGSSNLTQYDASNRRGFLRITFDGELGHSEYANYLAVKSRRATLPSQLPSPPYTPTFNAIELDYYSNGQEMEGGVDQFFYLHPFGGYEQARSEDAFAKATLFKDFTADDQRGYLYLGFSQLEGNANLSLLVQTVEGSEKRPELDAPELIWWYLRAHNDWAEIPIDKILLDSTNGFTRSGLVQLAIPEDLSSEGNTLLNPALKWLRVTAIENQNPERRTAALPDLAYLHAQVIEAKYVSEDGAAHSFIESGLPAGSISKLAISQSAVKKVEQPFASFNGRGRESEGMDFYQRVSERLRHRDRAVTVWDYEHLLLEAFPTVAAAKCIPHTQYRVQPASELAPGQVAVAVIPDLNKRAGAARNQPRFPKGDLDDMRDFLLERATLFLGAPAPEKEPFLHVTNAQYEPIKVEVRVKFRHGADIAFSKIQLDKDLRHFLSPWLQEGGKPPAFNVVLRRSGLIRFMEELSYVDYVDVDSLKLNGEDVFQEYLSPSAAHGILCSANEHAILHIP